MTPTEGVYAELTPRSAVFLHRPWGVERSRLGQGNLVLTSHQRLDEVLTTGYNLALMDSLGLGSGSGLRSGEERGEIIGYKGDPERKMGVVVQVPEELSGRTIEDWKKALSEQFDGLEGDNFSDLVSPTSPEGEKEDDRPRELPRPRFIACMNAFEPVIMDRLFRVISHPTATAENPNDTPLYSTRALQEIDPSEVFYITGEPRPLGTEKAKKIRLPTVFVGHNRSEVWAIRWLAEQAREKLGKGWEVVVVDEPEVERPKPVKPKGGSERKGSTKINGAGRSRKRKSEGDVGGHQEKEQAVEGAGIPPSAH